FVIANHWCSKGGDDPLFGARQPPRQESSAQRVAQARAVRAFADELIAAGAPVLVLGDLNDFPSSEPLSVLTAGGGLVELTDRLPEVERYSFIYQGNSQQLDHILASPALAALCSEARPVHVDCEFAGPMSDHDPVIARFETGD
ncbi:MAG TPA: endonuclease/exonuclease/phosphatase family protein, partial [Planctomycetota bacterium]|nr:endonuclease/exonuclease/phosphatase family protein [Planctomycetota bacterium]